MGPNNVLKGRLAAVIPAAWVAVFVAVGGLLGVAPVAAAAPPALAGETLSATIAQDDFSASCWTSGSYTVDFSLQGTAAGPYPGTFTESGTVTYALHRYLYSSDGAVAWAKITAFSGTFTITSAATTVTGTTRLDASLPGEQEANCGGGRGGQALGVAVGTRYAATITTPSGSYADHGSTTATLSGVNTGNYRFQTSLAESFGGPAAAPVSTTPPTIAGVSAPAVSASAGGELTAFQPGWANDAVAYAYQWLRCDTAGVNCSPIWGAAGRSYTPQTADVGSTLRVRQWASNTAGTGAPATSEPSGVIAPRPSPIAPPVIAGTAAEGQWLHASRASWTSGLSAGSYQWQRCDSSGGRCTPIPEAGAPEYLLTAGDVGHTIRVAEWPYEDQTGPQTISAATAVVQPSPAPAGSPPPPGAPASGPPQGSAGAPRASASQLTGAQIRARLRRRLTPAGRDARIPVLLKAGGYRFSFSAPSAGRMAISWHDVRRHGHLRRAKAMTIATGTVRFARAGRVTLTVRLTAAGRRIVKAARRLRLTAKGRYISRGHPAVTVGRAFTLRR